tara:strand:- start:1294 stop:1491 length:198 start_codon:yes stop_codon:yes gene_type:complete
MHECTKYGKGERMKTWKYKGKTVYVDDPTNYKGWKGIATTYSEKNSKLICVAVNKYIKKVLDEEK